MKGMWVVEQAFWRPGISESTLNGFLASLAKLCTSQLTTCP